MLTSDYEKWIDKHSSTRDQTFSKCRQRIDEMALTFPELKKVLGIVLLSTGLTREHWWLKTPDGNIVDPTSSQYNTDYYGFASIVDYQEREGPLPEGKCAYCGQYIYPNHEGIDFHDSCRDLYAAELNDDIRSYR